MASMMSAPLPTATDEALAAELAATWGGVRRRLRRGARAAVGGEPLTGSQIELLRLVEGRPGIGVRDAAATLHLAPNTVSTLVGGLVALGLLDRAPDPGDRRAARLFLTAAATERIRRWRDERDRLLSAALAELDPADTAALRASLPALERLLAVLERDA
jgi:DNA-binding MarR family transcriptional regulator